VREAVAKLADIHEIMLRDTTRTVTYARFLLSNPKVFEGAIVMDVGCGTGILSSKSIPISQNGIVTNNQCLQPRQERNMSMLSKRVG
jgi:2-polyprenyl-3-methyl-5-hydroxy-6-metoxy-1,4-benzoquinol methylase